MALPKATVALPKPTLPLGGASTLGVTSVQKDEDEDEEGEAEPFINVALSAAGLVAALIVLTFQLMTASAWISAEDNPRSGEWSQLSPF